MQKESSLFFSFTSVSNFGEAKVTKKVYNKRRNLENYCFMDYLFYKLK